MSQKRCVECDRSIPPRTHCLVRASVKLPASPREQKPCARRRVKASLPNAVPNSKPVETQGCLHCIMDKASLSEPSAAVARVQASFGALESCVAKLSETQGSGSAEASTLAPDALQAALQKAEVALQAAAGSMAGACREPGGHEAAMGAAFAGAACAGLANAWLLQHCTSTDEVTKKLGSIVSTQTSLLAALRQALDAAALGTPSVVAARVLAPFLQLLSTAKDAQQLSTRLERCSALVGSCLVPILNEHSMTRHMLFDLVAEDALRPAVQLFTLLVLGSDSLPAVRAGVTGLALLQAVEEEDGHATQGGVAHRVGEHLLDSALFIVQLDWLEATPHATVSPKPKARTRGAPLKKPVISKRVFRSSMEVAEAALVGQAAVGLGGVTTSLTGPLTEKVTVDLLAAALSFASTLFAVDAAIPWKRLPLLVLLAGKWHPDGSLRTLRLMVAALCCPEPTPAEPTEPPPPAARRTMLRWLQAACAECPQVEDAVLKQGLQRARQALQALCLDVVARAHRRGLVQCVTGAMAGSHISEWVMCSHCPSPTPACSRSQT